MLDSKRPNFMEKYLRNKLIFINFASVIQEISPTF